MQIISSDDYGCLYGATSFLWNYTKILSHTGDPHFAFDNRIFLISELSFFQSFLMTLDKGVVRQSLTRLKVPRSHKPMKRRFGTTP